MVSDSASYAMGDPPPALSQLLHVTVGGAAGSEASSTRGEPSQPIPSDIQGFAALMAEARIPTAGARSLLQDMVALGAVDVTELTKSDWESLPSWGSLLLFEKRRLLSHISRQ